MMKSLHPTNGMSAPDTKVLNDIERVGWHVIRVFAQPGEEGPEWAYSIGLFHTVQHPEVIIFGLPLNVCGELINVIGKHVKSERKYSSGQEYPDILQDPFRCAFREVPSSQFAEYVGYALWFYEHDSFPLLQCFWPDKQGLFLWDDGCNEDVKNAQPMLFRDSTAR